MSESLRDSLSYDSNCFIEMLYQFGIIHGSSGMSIFVCYLSWCVHVGVGFGTRWWIWEAPRDFGDKLWLPTRWVLDAWWREWYKSEACIHRIVMLEQLTTWSTTRVVWSSTWFAIPYIFIITLMIFRFITWTLAGAWRDSWFEFSWLSKEPL